MTVVMSNEHDQLLSQKTMKMKKDSRITLIHSLNKKSKVETAVVDSVPSRLEYHPAN